MAFRSPARNTAVAVVCGAGVALALRALDRSLQTATRSGSGNRHRVVIVGAGFAGLQAAQTLVSDPDVDLLVIDRHNHHLFQPLLYQVATAALGPDDISTPIRDEIPSSVRAQVRMDTVIGIDHVERQVVCDGQSFPYDTLILATGSETSYFGHETWRQHAHGLKALSDALDLRQHILQVFENAANLPEHDPERRRLLTFALIGGGPTGVEMAGSIAELAHDERQRNFGSDPTMQARVVLIEAAPSLLTHFPSDLSQRATSDLINMNVEIRAATKVSDITSGAVHIGTEVLEAGTIIWTAGVQATPVATWLGIKPAHGGQIYVNPDLSVPGHPEIFVAGDAAMALGKSGKPLPGLAPVAKQQGHYVANVIIGQLDGRAAPEPFVYRDFGTLATIGRNRAVAQFGQIHLTGLPAWLTWAAAHIFFLIGFRNRFLVSTKWLFAYVTRQRGGRVIT